MRHICISRNQQMLLGSSVRHDRDLPVLFLLSCWAQWAPTASASFRSLLDQPFSFQINVQHNGIQMTRFYNKIELGKLVLCCVLKHNVLLQLSVPSNGHRYSTLSIKR